MNTIVKAAIPFVAVFVAGYLLGRYGTGPEKSESRVVTVTRYLDRPSFSFKMNYTPPSVRTIYNTVEVEQLVEVPIYVPREYPDFNIVGMQPISVGADVVTFRYFDPHHRREVVEDFAVPVRAWDFNLYGDFAFVGGLHPWMGGRAEVRYKNLYVRGGVYGNPVSGDVVPVVGGSWRF